MALDHTRIKVTSAAGCDLLHRKSEAAQPLCIVFCLNVACQHGDTPAIFNTFESPFEQAGFTGAWRTDQIQAERSMREKSLAQYRSNAVILFQHFLFKRYLVHTAPSPVRPAQADPHS